jgi:CDP-glucose 4,6-dehydratase
MGAMVIKKYLEAFAGRRVMITGHTGFKGSWLAFLLKELGADVLGYALPPTDSVNHFDMLELSKSICHVEADICDLQKLETVMCNFKPEFVFHLAAQALVRPSYDDPKLTFETNVMGSVNLLEAVRNCEPVRSLVYITSDKCYENVEWVWGYRENDRLGGADPYSASKAAAELVFSSYVHSFFSKRPLLGAASTRAGNVIGGGDWALDRIIPDCIRAIQSNKPIHLRNPAATRPWQHVLEPLSGYLRLAVHLKNDPLTFSGAWNFGPSSNHDLTVADVAGRIVSHFGKGSLTIDKNKNNHQEAQLLQLNCDKAHNLLQWQPRWDAETTITMTANWYKEIEDGEKADVVTRKQLHKYFPEFKK